MAKPLLPLLRAALLLTSAVCALSLPECLPCGKTSVPYPLSTAPICGDPSYHISCCADAAGVLSLYFNSLNSTYLITSITNSTRRLTIAPSSLLPNTCIAADLSSNGLHLDPSGHFNITSSNTVLLLNFNDNILLSPLNCTAESLCHVFIKATPSASTCANTTCCHFRTGGSVTEHMIRVRKKGCLAYMSFVDLDPRLPVNQWSKPGVELEWA